MKFTAAMATSTAIVLFFTIGNPARSTAAEVFKVDPVHTSVIFKIKHLNVGNFYGMFTDAQGTVSLDRAEPANSNLDLVIKSDSLVSRNDKRDQHLKGPDFFNVKQFPDIKFTTTGLKKASGNTYDVTGNLSLHGVTKPISGTVEFLGTQKDPKGTERMGAEAHVTLKRSDFGVSFMPQGLSDNVDLIVSIEAIKQ
jgi:polyisoprenoid-binding protein YceI